MITHARTADRQAATFRQQVAREAAAMPDDVLRCMFDNAQRRASECMAATKRCFSMRRESNEWRLQCRIGIRHTRTARLIVAILRNELRRRLND